MRRLFDREGITFECCRVAVAFEGPRVNILTALLAGDGKRHEFALRRESQLLFKFADRDEVVLGYRHEQVIDFVIEYVNTDLLKLDSKSLLQLFNLCAARVDLTFFARNRRLNALTA